MLNQKYLDCHDIFFYNWHSFLSLHVVLINVAQYIKFYYSDRSCWGYTLAIAAKNFIPFRVRSKTSFPPGKRPTQLLDMYLKVTLLSLYCKLYVGYKMYYRKMSEIIFKECQKWFLLHNFSEIVKKLERIFVMFLYFIQSCPHLSRNCYPIHYNSWNIEV